MSRPAPSLERWDSWRSARWRHVSAPHGPAALLTTEWLTSEPRAIDGLPGLWSAVDGAARSDAGIEVVAGRDVPHGDALLRTIVRDGAVGLRVFDPASARRRGLTALEAFPYDERWLVPGRFVPAPDGATRVVESVDGYRAEKPHAGTVEARIGAEDASLVVSQAADGTLSAVVRDGTSGDESYRFRFVPISAPDADGNVVIDFTRAFSPPCSFSDWFVCPLPAPSNILATRIEAGEHAPRFAA